MLVLRGSKTSPHTFLLLVYGVLSKFIPPLVLVLGQIRLRLNICLLLVEEEEVLLTTKPKLVVVVVLGDSELAQRD
jgi:hypothetical protein